MDVLVDWLRPFIEAAFCKTLCLDLPEGRQYLRYRRLQPTTNGDLHVFTLRDTRYLQITKWCTPDPPYHSVVSDSYTRVGARFSEDAIQAFVAEMQKPLARGTKGALIAAHEFDLLIDLSKNDRSKAIMFIIKEFDLDGCEGAREYGNPEDVTSVSSIGELLDEAMARRRRAKEEVEAPEERTITFDDVTVPRDQAMIFLHSPVWANCTGSESFVPKHMLQRWDALVTEIAVKQNSEVLRTDVQSSLAVPTSSPPPESEEKVLGWSDTESQPSSPVPGDGDHDDDEIIYSGQQFISSSNLLPPDTPSSSVN
ncbi:hypothetical protein KEM54_001081 [Ascosphaera aggregata]|nr:hypothetical protein KEM54_001081 [Ascosphaera aggregata]